VMGADGDGVPISMSDEEATARDALNRHHGKVPVSVLDVHWLLLAMQKVYLSPRGQDLLARFSQGEEYDLAAVMDLVETM